MAVFSLLPVYRLLGIGLLIYLQYLSEVCAGDQHNRNGSLDGHLQQSNDGGNTHSESSRKMGRIEASIIPIVNSERHAEEKESSRTFSKAEVRVVVPKESGTLRNSLIRPPDPHEEGLIRASSILMEYEEDTRKYIHPGARTHSHEHRIRHSLHKHIAPEPLLDDYFSANDAPLNEIDSSSPTDDPQTKTNDEDLSSSDSKVDPTRILVHVNSFSSAPRRRYPSRKSLGKNVHANTIPKAIASTRTFKPLGQDSVIAFHSPVRIYIPVRYDATSSPPELDTDTSCVRCPQNITLMASRGETQAETPVPAISICHRLARQRRPINVAITAGPRPGTRIPEGNYLIELAVWIADHQVHSCQYALDVIVKKCEDVFPPSDGSVHCSHGTVWGSKCNFSCSSGYELLGHHMVVCEEHSHGMSWSSPLPKCKKIPYKYSPSEKNLPCLKPRQPSDGTVVCDSNEQTMYPDGSVCQFFCYPGFLIENLLTSNMLIVCKNGQWTPNSHVQCLATYCSDPRQPEYGSMRCNDKDAKEASFKSKYKNGTSCHFQCEVGYVIPKSQRHLNRITCHAPHWNDSSLPECKQKIVPRPFSRDCRDTILTANRRGFSKLKPPRFYMKSSSGNKILYGNCTYTGRINVGTYINHCSAYNKELNAIGHCSFSITVKENSCSPPPVVAHSKLHCEHGGTHSFPRGSVCRYICNRDFVIPRRQRKFQSKKCTSNLLWKPDAVPQCKRSIPPKPRKGSCIPQIIFAKYGVSAKIKLPKFKSSLRGSKVKVKCTLNGTLPIGHYTNHCDAVDKQLGLSSSCSYNITIQNQLPPVPVDDSCINRSTVIEDISTYKIPLPKFKSVSGTVEVNCEPQNVSEYGIYSVNCSAFDPELRIQSHCIFELEILKVNGVTELSREEILGCPQLPIIPSGSLMCSESTNEEFLPIGTICSYHCDQEYVVPTSFLVNSDKICIGHEEWNSTVSPVCMYQSPPVAEVDSCLDRSTTAEELASFQYNVPQFKSSNGAVIKAECDPSNIIRYAEWNISCSAYDPELRVHGFCSFMLNVQSPNNVAALSGEEISCSYPEKIENGVVQCNSSFSKLYSIGTVCEVICHEGFTLPVSQLTMSSSICLSNGEWNISSKPLCLKSEQPILVSGCENSTVYISDVSLVNMQLPVFYTSQNTSVFVTCTPKTFDDYGEYEILCTAHDIELGTSTECNFYLDLANNNSDIAITEEYSEMFSTTEQPYVICKAVESPHKGSVNCSHDPPIYCNISCDDGYEFSSKYQLLDSGKLLCDGINGLWNFEKEFGTHLLPECLGRLQNTFVEVELVFKAYVERCDDVYESELQSGILNLLIAMNEEMCQVVNCSSFNVSCFMDSTNKRYTIDNKWILKAFFDPTDYEDSNEVPEAEINIETIMDVTQKEINSKDSNFKKDLLHIGVELLQTTYNQSHFFLVCEKDGYGVDTITNKCVECPSDTMEQHGECVSCPEGYFQHSTGKSSCEISPEFTFLTANVSKPYPG